MKKIFTDIRYGFSFHSCLLIPMLIILTFTVRPILLFISMWLNILSILLYIIPNFLPDIFLFLFIKSNYKNIFNNIAINSFFISKNHSNKINNEKRDDKCFKNLVDIYFLLSLPLYIFMPLSIISINYTCVIKPKLNIYTSDIFYIIYSLFIIYLIFYVSLIAITYPDFLFNNEFKIENISTYIFKKSSIKYLFVYTNIILILFMPPIIIVNYSLDLFAYALLFFILGFILLIPISNIVSIRLYISDNNLIKKQAIMLIATLLCLFAVFNICENIKIKRQLNTGIVKAQTLITTSSIYYDEDADFFSKYENLYVYKDLIYFLKNHFEGVDVYTIDDKYKFSKVNSLNFYKFDPNKKQPYQSMPVILDDGKILFEKTVMDENGFQNENGKFDIWDIKTKTKKSLKINRKCYYWDYNITPLLNGDFLFISHDFAAKYNSKTNSFKIVSELEKNPSMIYRNKPQYLKISKNRYLIADSYDQYLFKTRKANCNLYIFDNQTDKLTKINSSKELSTAIFYNNPYSYLHAYSNDNNEIVALANNGKMYKFKIEDSEIKLLESKDTAISKIKHEYALSYLSNDNFLLTYKRKLYIYNIKNDKIAQILFDNEKLSAENYMPNEFLRHQLGSIGILRDSLVYFYNFDRILKIDDLLSIDK